MESHRQVINWIPVATCKPSVSGPYIDNEQQERVREPMPCLLVLEKAGRRTIAIGMMKRDALEQPPYWDVDGVSHPIDCDDRAVTHWCEWPGFPPPL